MSATEERKSFLKAFRQGHEYVSGDMMLYYVYFDGYGRAQKAIDENELFHDYQNDKDIFCQQMVNKEREHSEKNEGYIAGHVGTVRCYNQQDLNDYLDSLGDEIEGLYEGDMGARPFNF